MASSGNNHSLQSLRDVGERHPEGLDGGERVLEVQRVRVIVDPAKLHHLKKKFEIGRQCSLQFCVVLLPSLPALPITGFGVSAFGLRRINKHTKYHKIARFFNPDLNNFAEVLNSWTNKLSVYSI